MILSLTPQALRDWRKGAQISSRRLSISLGYSKGYVANLERGKQRITAAFIRRFREFQASREGGPIFLTPPRLCACGCGLFFIGGPPYQKYLNRAHQIRGHHRGKTAAPPANSGGAYPNGGEEESSDS